jgi:pseudomonalisin
LHRSSRNVLCLAAAAALTAALGGGLLPALATSGQAPSASRAVAGVAADQAAGVASGSGAPGAISAASPSAAAVGSGAGGSTETIAADVLPGLNLLAPSGAAPAGQVLQIGVALALPDPSAVGAYVASEYDPSSPDYHRFLTPAGFAARFGVPAATYTRVLGWLRSGGLAIDETTAAGDWVEASGTVSQLDRLFGTTIDRYTTKGVTFLANTTPPSVPAGFSILSVVGLNTLQRFSTPKAPQVPQQAPTIPGCLPSCFYGPRDMWSMYDMPSSDFGQGQTLAIFGEGQTADVISNLRVFEKDNSLPQVPVTVDHVGPGPFTDDSGQVEWDLDTQASTGMAPDAYGVTMYFANSLYDASVESLFQAWVNDPTGPKQANASFGECETNPTNPVTGPLSQLPYGTELGDELEPVAEATLEQAVAEGRTLFASAGDTGSSCPVLVLPVVGAGNGVANQAVPFDNYPCASDWAVCVGGTELYSDGANPPHRALETAWEFTGGGAALFQAEPAFQKGDPAVDIPCLVDQTGSPFPPGTICRGAPDVAAMSGNVYDNGYDIVADGAPTVEGGTSLSSPLWVGMWTRIQAAAPALVTTAAAPRSSTRAKQETVTSVTYPGLGFADYSIYRVGESAAYSKDFYDITIGDNGYYHAAPGWDYVSGWGVPDVANLMSTLDDSETPTNDVMPPPPTNPSGSCNALWTNPAHTASDLFGNSDPQLTLLEGNMAPSADGKSLVVELTVEDLTKTVPTGATAEDWYMTWTYEGTTYFAQAQLSALPGSTPGFYDGTVNAVGTSHNYQTVNTDTGELVTGHDGVVEIDVPLAHVGNPAAGSVLGQPTGLTYIEVGVPPNPTGLSAGSLQQVDSGGPGNNYTVGTTTGTSGCTPSE